MSKLALEAMRRYNEVTVVDTSSTFTEATIAALEAADRVILVCTPDLATLRDVRECERIFQSVIHVGKDKVFYLMNNPLPYKALPNDQYEQTLGHKIDVEIPFGQDLPTRAATRGEPLLQAQPGRHRPYDRPGGEAARRRSARADGQAGRATRNRRVL